MARRSGEIAWREVQNEVPRREREPDRRECGTNTNAAFADASLGQPDDVETRKPITQADFDLDWMSLDPDEACGLRGGEHARAKCTARAGDLLSAHPELRGLLWRTRQSPPPSASAMVLSSCAVLWGFEEERPSSRVPLPLRNLESRGRRR